MNVFAIVLILFSSVAIGCCIINKESKHCTMLDRSIKIIGSIKNRAVNYSEPLADILSENVNSEDKIMKMLCLSFSENAPLHQNNISARWKKAVNDVFGAHLKEYECDVLIHFGEDLCACNRDEIEDIYNNSIYALTEFRKTATENKNTKAKSTAAISVSIGVMIVLMFI